MPKKSRKEWETIVSAFHSSNENKAAFAARHSINQKTLEWWIWTLGRDATAAPQEVGPPPETIELVPIDLHGGRPAAKIELEYAGMVIRLPADATAEFVGAVLLELRSTC